MGIRAKTTKTVKSVFRRKVGLSPGTLVAATDRDHSVHVNIMDYTMDHVDEAVAGDVEEAYQYAGTETITWLNIDGVHDIDIVQSLGEAYGIHVLTQEDIVNTHQRPKVEEYDDHLFIVLTMLYVDSDDGSILTEQLSLIVGKTFVISFQEAPGDVFEPVRQRIRAGAIRLRSKGADYLAYALVDVIVDNYFVVLESISARTEELETRVLTEFDPSIQQEISLLRRELIEIRKAIWPVREVVSALLRSESELIKQETGMFLRDTYDHTIRAVDLAESLRDMIAVLRDSYMTALSNRMNDIMKVLTIIGTIFIPLTFVAGIYGMNFAVMPELQWPYGYPVALGAMAVMAGLLVWFFKRKGWI